MTTQSAPPGLDRSIRRQGALITGFFALPWAATGSGWIGDGLWYWLILGGSVAMTIAAIVLAFTFKAEPRRERRMPDDWRRRYNLVVILEVVLIAAAVAGLNVLDLSDMIPAVVALIVGLHFLPLATAFDQPQYRWTGYGTSIAGAVGAAFVVTNPDLTAAIAGLGTAVVLWATSISVTRAG